MGAQLQVTPLIRSDRLRAGVGSADIRLTSWLRRDRARGTGRFPGVETADQVRVVAEPSTRLDTGCD
jgi:hypothetical protein